MVIYETTHYIEILCFLKTLALEEVMKRNNGYFDYIQLENEEDIDENF